MKKTTPATYSYNMAEGIKLANGLMDCALTEFAVNSGITFNRGIQAEIGES